MNIYIYREREIILINSNTNIKNKNNIYGLYSWQKAQQLS